jgi:hypothetical protein
MNDSFRVVIGAPDEERLDLFLTGARRLGTAVQNVEKDFWVCWTLDVLFNGLGRGASPRLLFKGGTSLSKAFGLIARFSEDIDITVFRADLGQGTSLEELEALSGKKRRAGMDAIKAACQAFIGGPLREGFIDVLSDFMKAAGVPEERYRLELDPDDPDRQSLLLWYPAVSTGPRDYVRPAVKIESGAKSAVDPNVLATLKPYVADDVPNLDLRVADITTVLAERTFWDKVIILHGLQSWFDRRGQLRHGGQRVSRHYYDVFCLLQSSLGERALTDRDLAADCARHARMFFHSHDLDLEHAVPGTLLLAPSSTMLEPLRRDYDAMTGMILGAAPAFDEVVAAIAALELRLNEPI